MQNNLMLLEQIDKKMEDALRHTVKRSLQELSRVLNGDNKTEVVPVFTVTINLGKTNRVELKPTVQVCLLPSDTCLPFVLPQYTIHQLEHEV